MEPIDKVHAELINTLLTAGVEYIEQRGWYSYYVLLHTYDDTGPLSQALALGIQLRDVLIVAGYEAVVVSNIVDAVGGSPPLVLIPTDMEGVDLILNYYSETYWIHMYDPLLQYAIGTSFHTMKELVDYLPTFISKRQKDLLILRECRSCHWGDDRGQHCGIGLVGTGECGHYMGRAPH